MPLIVKNTTFPGLLDLLVPHSCRGCGCIGEALCNRCKNYIYNQHHNFCPRCKASTPTGICDHCKDLPPIFVATERAGLIDELIHDYKYSSNRSLAMPLADILDNCLPHISSPTIVVPLPTISKHLRARGFDHTKLIAKHLAKKHSNWQVKQLLIRTNSTVQVGSTKKDRVSQASKAYEINPKIKINPKSTYLLIDDVWTTGASMEAAIKKLRQAGVSQISVGILAVSTI
ncbi:ComF family protein [Candidatus Saccharibacteria bacterium]|nr:ComF family protein [Candidatus Saccharibacteria bacterium]